ncbi:MAG: hypothetical protein ACOC0P_02120 [Planctomycetota bacterium]
MTARAIAQAANVSSAPARMIERLHLYSQPAGYCMQTITSSAPREVHRMSFDDPDRSVSDDVQRIFGWTQRAVAPLLAGLVMLALLAAAAVG